MNKFSKLFVGLATVALMASCSSDEPNPGNNEPNENKPLGDVAYMAIQIKATDSRADLNDDNKFQDGSANEHAVNNAQFFFYDAKGNFVIKAKIVNPSFEEDGTGDNDVANIEYFAKNNILVLEDLTGKSNPVYLFTVLNAPDFKPESTLAATTEALNNYKQTISNVEYYVMSTTAYFGDTNNHDDNYYNANKLVEGNFYTTKEGASTADPVVIYVERLAAKVQVGCGISGNDKVETFDGKTYYKLTQTIAGNDNDQNVGTSPTAISQLYLLVEGWDLNATANNSHMGKQLISNWATNPPFINWNAADRNRSYWANSVQYDTKFDAAKQLSYVKTPDFTATTGNGLYSLASEAHTATGAAAYCNENTNTVENLFSETGTGNLIAANTTHVLVYATVCEKVTNDEGVTTGFQPVDMISLNGVLYREQSLLGYILTVVENTTAGKNALNVYFLDSSLTTETATVDDYTPFGTADLDFYQPEGATYEQCKVQIKSTTTAKQAYKKNADGTFSPYSADEKWAETLTTQINSAQGSKNLVRYKDGKTVYIIPIEHEKATTEKTLANYGVVRNHWYYVNINKFTKVGHGIYDPKGGQEIKPNQPEDPTYCVDATIKVVNWRLVTQNADL